MSRQIVVEAHRSAPRYLASRAASGVLSRARALPASAGVPLAPLRLAERERPEAGGDPRRAVVEVHLAGICGSDLATVTGRSSWYFSPLVSWPFVPGHEVVGHLLEDCADLPAGTRVVLDPVLGCAARGLTPCTWCAAGQANRCGGLAGGHLRPGLQTGFCADAGGGWSARLLAHRSQLHPVPDGLPDEAAVLTEPMACAVHAARRAQVDPGAQVVVVGAGAVGLLTTLALRELSEPGHLLAVAKHPAQQQAARRVGADAVVAPDQALGRVRSTSGGFRLSPQRGADFLLGGADVVVEATGSSAGLDLALRCAAPGARVVLAGMPAAADLTPAWFQELEVVGAYASCGSDFPDALALLAGAHTDGRLDGLVASPYPLEQWSRALDAALSIGASRASKIVFDPRRGSERKE